MTHLDIFILISSISTLIFFKLMWPLSLGSLHSRKKKGTIIYEKRLKDTRSREGDIVNWHWCDSLMDVHLPQ